MNKKQKHLFSYTLLLVLALQCTAIPAILIVNGQYFFGAIFFVLSVFGFAFFINLNSLNRRALNKLYLRLFSLIASLKLESMQDSLHVQKKVETFSEIEDTVIQLEKAIESKTNEFRRRNNELKNKQVEVLKQNKELVAAYDALKESRERYEKLVKNLEEEYFFYGADLKGNLLYVSPSVRNILGYSVSEYKERFSDIITPNAINKEALFVMEKTKKGISQPRYLLEVFHLNCEPRILEILEIPIYNAENEFVSIEGLAHDITERHTSEELIKEKEAKYRQVFNSASDFIFIYNVEKDGKPGKFIEVNEYTQQVLGYSQEELLHLTPDNLNAAEIWTEQHEREPSVKYERIWEAKDGSIINVEISEHLIKVKNRKACIAVARDISARKKAIEEIQFMNEELINQKENLEALLDNLTQTQEQLVQSEKMAALGQLIAGVAHEINTPLGAIKASVGNLSDSLASALEQLPRLFQSQSEDNLNLFLETFEKARIKKQELSSREKREKKRAVRRQLKDKGIDKAELLADTLGYLEIYEGVDEMENLLSQENALEVLKNVRDFISLIKNTHTISIASEKASKVVFALKKYAHRDTLGEKVPTDIVDGIETVLTLYDNQFKQGIKVEKKYDTLPIAMCYQDEINQVWTNLIQNGIQSMGQAGILTISAHSDERSVHVSITDTGEGIDPGIVDKIFDPFFTTKKQGEGSGLGLDIVKKIIDKHGGSINVLSKIGEGSTFIIEIPLV